ncbi:hypothetical protein [Profundibacterium mesophilum]|uniref:Uncharacterized protein n=1 Tax=Profundibacterium mesophilum KAUST100406-0324 TaxID=1037889 RepID=A0A921NRK4_9RHOB|nr:hypothetical protein [Profundibacterium mesophilum]KAF0676460.1 hypothetical protein PMES_01192 [Profundibacterium mesophilum KAUST100406-0324]
MGEAVCILRARKLVFVRYFGSYAVPDLLRVFDRITYHPDHVPDLDLLHDLRGITDISISDGDLGQLASMAKGHYARRTNTCRTALLASRPSVLQGARAFERLVADNPLVDLRSFDQEGEALRFLGIEDMAQLFFGSSAAAAEGHLR